MRIGIATTAAVLLCVLAGGVSAADGSSGAKDVVLVTHDSFAISKTVKAAFEHQTGLKLRILQTGDAGAALNRALLTAGKPEGDVLFGVDNNLLTRALGGNLLVPYSPPGLSALDPAYDLDPTHRLVPVDHSEVCVVYDRAWFARNGMPPPGSLAELSRKRYARLTVVENPATSTPGLAFMLATIARFGPNNGFSTFWHELRDGGVLVTNGWEEAYETRFSGSSGHKGKRPIVVSYSTDPAAEVYFAGKPVTTSPVAIVPGTCFRQIEFAGVLRGAKNPDAARQLVDFLLSPTFQKGMPLTMFVLPAREGVALPSVFRRFAPAVTDPLQLPARTIGSNRDRWIREWTDIVVR